MDFHFLFLVLLEGGALRALMSSLANIVLFFGKPGPFYEKNGTF